MANHDEPKATSAFKKGDGGSMSVSTVVSLLVATLGVGSAGGGGAATWIATSKVETKLERIENLLQDVRADLRDHEGRLRALELWRAQVDAGRPR